MPEPFRVYDLILKDTIRTIPDGDSDTVLGNALLKILAGSTRDTAAFGQDAVDAGRALLLKAVGASSELALWKASDLVRVELESALDITGEKAPSRVTISPMTKPSQHNWLGSRVIPNLVVEMSQPKQLGQALRRSFVLCDMDPQVGGRPRDGRAGQHSVGMRGNIPTLWGLPVARFWH